MSAQYPKPLWTRPVIRETKAQRERLATEPAEPDGFVPRLDSVDPADPPGRFVELPATWSNSTATEPISTGVGGTPLRIRKRCTTCHDVAAYPNHACANCLGTGFVYRTATDGVTA